jgi:hypothetical protein
MHQFHHHRPACLDLRQPAGPTKRVIWFGDTIGPELANRRAESYAVFRQFDDIYRQIDAGAAAAARSSEGRRLSKADI